MPMPEIPRSPTANDSPFLRQFLDWSRKLVTHIKRDLISGDGSTTTVKNLNGAYVISASIPELQPFLSCRLDEETNKFIVTVNDDVESAQLVYNAAASPANGDIAIKDEYIFDVPTTAKTVQFFVSMSVFGGPVNNSYIHVFWANTTDIGEETEVCSDADTLEWGRNGMQTGITTGLGFVTLYPESLWESFGQCSVHAPQPTIRMQTQQLHPQLRYETANERVVLDGVVLITGINTSTGQLSKDIPHNTTTDIYLTCNNTSGFSITWALALSTAGLPATTNYLYIGSVVTDEDGQCLSLRSHVGKLIMHPLGKHGTINVGAITAMRSNNGVIVGWS